MAGAFKTPIGDLYDVDFYAWTQDQAARLRARGQTDNAGDVDWTHAAEEIESLGSRERREIRSRLGVLLKHLLKWRYQPAFRSESWDATISERRMQIAQALLDSPSLHGFPDQALDWAYGWAVRDAARETGLSKAVFPTACPFSVGDILDPDFYPDAP